MNKTTLWIVIIFGLILLVFGLAKLGSAPDSNGAKLPLAVSDEDRYKGGFNANVTIVEYSDFQCPACSSMYPILKSLSEEFGDNIKFVYRHFPLRQIHANSGIAAQAAESAGLQGKFWEMHDILFNTQNVWSSNANPIELFTKYGESLGLDAEQFIKDLDSDFVKDKVARDEKSASALTGTPTFFLNGVEIKNPGTYDGFKQLVEETLTKK